jgi:hypothetical protein
MALLSHEARQTRRNSAAGYVRHRPERPGKVASSRADGVHRPQRILVVLETLARLMLSYCLSYSDGKSGMYRSLRKIATYATLAIAGLLAVQANAALVMDVTTSTATDFDFTISGDFSGYTPPTSLTNHLYIVPMDNGGIPLTTWVPFEQTGDRPDGAMNGDTITGWVFVQGDARFDHFSFLAGDSFTVDFSGGPYDSSAVMTSAYTRSQTGLTLNPAGIDHFNLYWGRTVLLASTGPVGPVSAAAPIPTLSAYGLILTMLGLLVVAGRRLRTPAKRR